MLRNRAELVAVRQLLVLLLLLLSELTGLVRLLELLRLPVAPEHPCWIVLHLLIVRLWGIAGVLRLLGMVDDLSRLIGRHHGIRRVVARHAGLLHRLRICIRLVGEGGRGGGSGRVRGCRCGCWWWSLAVLIRHVRFPTLVLSRVVLLRCPKEIGRHEGFGFAVRVRACWRDVGAVDAASWPTIVGALCVTRPSVPVACASSRRRLLLPPLASSCGFVSAAPPVSPAASSTDWTVVTSTVAPIVVRSGISGVRGPFEDDLTFAEFAFFHSHRSRGRCRLARSPRQPKSAGLEKPR